MGTGRSFHRPNPRFRLRLLFMTFVVVLFVLYTLFPHNFSSDSVFQPKPQSTERQRHFRVQYSFRHHGHRAGDPTRADAVRETMKDTFWKYHEAAWGKDEVRPISGRYSTSRNGWAATLVDTLTTTLMMGLEDEFLLELEYVVNKLNFTHAVNLVDPFETTIRYLGALVSTVDLLDHNASPIAAKVSKTDRDRLLTQAVVLADKLAPSFDSPTGMVWPRVNFTTNEGCREAPEEQPYPDYDHATIGPARAGSNWLENMSLSRLTGQEIYGVNATKAWKPLVFNKWIEEWPGLIDGPWDIMTGTPFDGHRSWGAGHDSYYEYLIKAHILAPSDSLSTKYRDRWLQAVTSTSQHLIFPAALPSSTTRTPQKYLHQYRNGWLINEMGHLTCFAGGNLMLGGTYLGRSDITSLGADLVDTCHHTYISSETRIGPEYFQWFPSERTAAYEPQHEGQWEQVRKSGFWVTDARWMLRPETVESYFYAYRITGDKMYQEWAWDAYTAYVNASKAPHGYAEVQDVTKPAGPDNQHDKEESFWGSETLKYLYLIFCDEDVGNLDEWVFSTEAHPFKIVI